MLEVRNLSKIYRAKQKNGTDTHALDNVSLRFPEKGMVFLLGKSGSGKSTLLNVCGGLDAPTEGEIIVKGRSSKDFSQSDFDSYRNTFVGFIFQEYNILNEFSVEDNIALALELQGKPKDKKVIAELLEQVDLTGFAKRKPNTLSGGQKQRIAIARALVKAPEIIMADEPTGALDSATGKQVFDTLKKLSEDKLVIVVSHDREFAELYADRIIELKDGKILSDVTKTQEKQESISENITAIGDILCIKQGSDLTDDDFDRIKSLIKKNSGDLIIAGSEQDVQNFKKVNRITDDGEKEVFKDTDDSKTEIKTYTPEQSKFIRSKLPARHAAKIGVSGLKTKPVRLFFTILLCVVSFVLFGVLSTLMLYNNEAMFKHTLKDSEHDFIVFDKVYLIENSYYENGTLIDTYENISTAKFNSKEIDSINKAFGEGAFGAISINPQINLRQASSSYWTDSLSNAAYMPENAFTRRNLIGSYPENKNEICVSSYFANMIAECKTTDKNGAVISIENYTELIGKTILLDGFEFKVTGIFDSGVIDPKFDALKDTTNQDYSLRREFDSIVSDGTHLLIGVSEDGLKWFADRYENMFGYYHGDNNRRGNAYIDHPFSSDSSSSARQKGIIISDKVVIDGVGSELAMNGSTVYYSPISSVKSSAYILLENGKTTIADNEAIVPFALISNTLSSILDNKRQEINNISDETEGYQSQIEELDNLSRDIEIIRSGREYISSGKDESTEKIYSTDERAELLKELIQKYPELVSDLTLKFSLSSYSSSAPLTEEASYKVVGIVIPTNTPDNYVEDVVYFSDKVSNEYWDIQKAGMSYHETSTKYKDEDGAVYTKLYVPYDRSDAQTDRLWDIYNTEEFSEDGSKIGLRGNHIDSLKTIDSFVDELSKIFFYVGLVLAVFAILLFSNFISVSISQKRREIGILRAVGARSLDVFKIFFSESLVIAAICSILSIAGSAVLCQVLNTELGSALGASIFVFGAASILIIFAIALLTAFLATFLPVWNAAKKKPVDSIRAL